MTATILRFPTKELSSRTDDLMQEYNRLFEQALYLVIAAVELQLSFISLLQHKR